MSGVNDDPVPSKVIIELGEALRILEALEDSKSALHQVRLVPGLQEELATVIRMLHDKLGFEEGGLI